MPVYFEPRANVFVLFSSKLFGRVFQSSTNLHYILIYIHDSTTVFQCIFYRLCFFLIQFYGSLGSLLLNQYFHCFRYTLKLSEAGDVTHLSLVADPSAAVRTTMSFYRPGLLKWVLITKH